VVQRKSVAVVHSEWAGSTCAAAQRLNMGSLILVGFHVNAWKQFFEQQVHVCHARLTRACLSAEVAEEMIKREHTQRGTATSLWEQFSLPAGKSNARAAEGAKLTPYKLIARKLIKVPAYPADDHINKSHSPHDGKHNMHVRLHMQADHCRTHTCRRGGSRLMNRRFNVTTNNVHFKRPGRADKSRF
jgi:hypothetical protein